jgi:D-alanyl-D-alanine dipeptidase
MNKFTPNQFRVLFNCKTISLRTLQKFLGNNFEELEDRDYIYVNNKEGLRKQYNIIDPIELKQLILKTYTPNSKKIWIINPED